MQNIEIYWKDYLTNPCMSFGEFLAFKAPEKYALWSKTGYNADVDAGTEDVWGVGGSYAFPASALTLVAVSSSANDGAGTKAGVNSIVVYYLTTLGVEKTVNVTLNGTGEVAVASDIYRIQNCRALTTGSNKVASGNIDIKVSGGTVYTRILAGYTRARNSAWTVPAGKKLHVNFVNYSVGGATKEKTAILSVMATYDDKRLATLDFFMPYFEAIVEDQNVPIDLRSTPFTLPAGVDVKVRAIGLVADCYISSTMRGIVETI